MAAFPKIREKSLNERINLLSQLAVAKSQDGFHTVTRPWGDLDLIQDTN